MSGGWSDEPTPSGLTKLEVRNSLELTDYVKACLRTALSEKKLVVAPEMILRMQEIAMRGVIETVGRYRDVDRERPITFSKHQPPPYADVPALVASMCDHINETVPCFNVWEDDETGGLLSLRAALEAGIDVATYALWRTNWIHPFEDGNGRTSRALAYLLLSVHSGFVIPGERTLPERIYAERAKFYRCLEAADVAYKKKKRIRVQQLREFLKKHFVAQLNEGAAQS